MHQKGPKSKKKSCAQGRNSLQLRELGVQNTTAVYPWVFSLSLHQRIQQQTKRLTVTEMTKPHCLETKVIVEWQGIIKC